MHKKKIANAGGARGVSECHWRVHTLSCKWVLLPTFAGFVPSSIFKNRPYSFVDRKSVPKNTACACLEAALRQPWRVVHEKQCVNKSSYMNPAAESKFATRK